MGCRTSSYEPVNDDHECDTVPSVQFTGESFDSFTLIWLDKFSAGNDLESLKTKSLLLQICKDCLFYDNCDSISSDIEQSRLAKKKTLLIMSPSFVNEFLSRANLRDHICTALIFSHDAFKYKRMQNHCIVGICQDLTSLKKSILREISSLKLNLYENQPFQSVRLLSPSADDYADSGIYYKYMLFIELFRRMPHTNQAMENMLQQSEDYYRAHPTRLNQIKQFRDNYRPDKAINWYIKDEFLYRLVNLAFRTEDVSLWYTYYYYITDLCAQLEEVHREQKPIFRSTRIKLWRGQSKMLRTEFEKIKSRNNGLVATTGFFSTSYERSVAEKYVLDIPESDHYVTVLFEVLIDTDQVTNIVFVDIKKYLSSRDMSTCLADSENEVLFNIGSVFKVLHVYYADQWKSWVIKMEATDEGVQEVKCRINLMLENIGNRCIHLFFGQQMLEMSYYVAADYYFKQMVQELPEHHHARAAIYDLIGDTKMRITNWRAAYTNFHQAYLIRKKYRSARHPDMGISNVNMAGYYNAIGCRREARRFYQKALKCVGDQLHIAFVKVNLAGISAKDGQYLQALELCNDLLVMLDKMNPTPTTAIFVCHGIMGDIYCAKEEYIEAEKQYAQAFKLAKKILFADDYRLMQCIEALAIVYERLDNGNSGRATRFCQEQLSNFTRDLSDDHISIAHMLMILGKLSGDVNEYEKALQIFERNIAQGYAFTENCLSLIGKHHIQQERWEEALKFFKRAHQIQRKIYPLNHSLVAETNTQLDKLERVLRQKYS